jgi:hypothetical protein
VGDIVQGLWVGPALSRMEQLSIQSFMDQGHTYHLYAYGPVAHVPGGALVLDAGSILPASMIFQYRAHPSLAGFANYFRYRLLREKGGWWADLDVICLRPLLFEEAYVFASEPLPRGGTMPTAWLIKAPAGSEAMNYAWQVCRSKDVSRLLWGEVGAQLLRETIESFGLGGFVRETQTFCPIPYPDWDRATLPEDSGGISALPPAAYTVHLWNEMWRRGGRDKNADFPPDCLYERLQARFRGATS